VYLYSNGTIDAIANIIGTGATLDTTSGVYTPPVDPSWAFDTTYVNASGNSAPVYDWEVYDDTVDYEAQCSACAYSPQEIDNPVDELYAFDVRFGGVDGASAGGYYPTEIEWSIEEGESSTESSYTLVNQPYTWPYNLEQDAKIELKAGIHTLHMFDSYGDGWNLAQWELYHWNSDLPVIGGSGQPITCSFEFTGTIDWSQNHHTADDPLATDPTQPSWTHPGGRKLTEERKLVSEANRRQLHWGRDCDTFKDGACRKCEFVIPLELEMQEMTGDAFSYVKAHDASAEDAVQPFTGESLTWAPTSMPTMQPTNLPTCNWQCI